MQVAGDIMKRRQEKVQDKRTQREIENEVE